MRGILQNFLVKIPHEKKEKQSSQTREIWNSLYEIVRTSLRVILFKKSGCFREIILELQRVLNIFIMNEVKSVKLRNVHSVHASQGISL